MLRLSRYLIRETTGLYILGVAAFCMLLSIDLLSAWARFLIEHDATLATVGRLMLYKLPLFLHLSMPIAIVFAILLATGRLAKDSELKAAYSLGAQPFRLLSPFLLVGVIVSLLAFFNNGYLEPYSQRAYERLENSFFYTRPPAEVQTNVAFRAVDGGIYFAGRVSVEPENREQADLSGVLIIADDGSRITAPSGLWNSSERNWTVYDAEVFDNGETRTEAELTIPFEVDTKAADSLSKEETLTLGELNQRLSETRQAGGEVRDLRYSFHSRIADAFSALLFAFIASVLGLQIHKRSAGFAWTIVLLVLFWAIWTLSGSFYDRGVLSPIMAAWFTSMVVGAIAFVVAWLRLR